MTPLSYTVTIDRAKWSTGRTRRVKREGENVLRHGGDGKCCALGHYAQQVLGLKDSVITDRLTILGALNTWDIPARGITPDHEDRIAAVNDDSLLRQRQREQDLIRLFRDWLDTDLSFTGRFRA